MAFEHGNSHIKKIELVNQWTWTTESQPLVLQLVTNWMVMMVECLILNILLNVIQLQLQLSQDKIRQADFDPVTV
jgi:hypothetical protein